MNKKLKTKLMKEFKAIGYGQKDISLMTKKVQDYIIDRHNRGIKELKDTNKFPTKTGDNGYTSLLGIWGFTKSKGIDCSIGLKSVWMATILNNDLI